MMRGLADMRRPIRLLHASLAGSILLEALISILIFSVGMLALIGMQATTIKQVGDAKYRTDASLLANDLIGQMWLSDRTPANLTSQFSSPSGAAYLQWLARVTPVLAGSAAHPPSVDIRTLPGTLKPHTEVKITMQWQLANAPLHQYILVAEIH
jgi:type IV pilus assembly protein PilV